MMIRIKLLLAFFIMLVSLAGCIYLPQDLPPLTPHPVIQRFEIDPAEINQGNSARMSWYVQGATTVFIDGEIGSVAIQGSTVVSPRQTTVYTLTATNAFGSTTARTRIIVKNETASTLDPVIHSFKADREIISQGESVTLSWDVSNVTQTVIEQFGTVAAKGVQTVTPQLTTTYKLVASNGSGIVNAIITVIVNPPLTGAVDPGRIILTPVQSESGSLIKSDTTYIKNIPICVGDTSLNLASRGFMSFDISSIPRNAILQEAVLDLSECSIAGNPTYAISLWGNMGAFEVYHYQYGSFTELDSMAYNRAAKLTRSGSYMNYPQNPWRWDVKESSDGEPVIQQLLQSGINRCQFRLQFFTSTNWNSSADMLCFDKATLTISYKTP